MLWIWDSAEQTDEAETDGVATDEVETDGGTTSSQTDLSSGPSVDEATDIDSMSAAQLRERLREVKEERDEAQDRVEELESTVRDQKHRLYDLEGSLAELQGVIEANASGDLTRRADIDSDVDAVVDLVSSYDRMLDEWNETLQRVKEFSTTVDDATTEVAEEVETVEQESERVSESITQIADGANDQNSDLQQIGDEMRSLSATIQQVAASANEVASNADQAVARGDSAQEAATKAVSDLDSMEQQTERMVDRVEELNDLMGDIEEITEFISDVAENTNILALNANIEAARAGEAGEGFAVVANEVKQLATETKEATEEISSTVQEVREQTETTVEDMHETREVVSQTEQAVQAAIDGLNEVVEVVNEVSVSIKEVDSATEQQAHVTQSVVSMVQDAVSVSEKTAEGAQTVSDAAQTQTELLTDVSQEVGSLSDQAEELGETSAQFTTGERAKHTVSKDDTVVEFWHAMGGAKALLLHDLAQEFEETTEGIHFRLSSMGSYDGVLEETLAASERGETPAIAQINEIGSMQARQSGAFKPAQEVVPQQSINSLADSVRDYYTIDGTLNSVPFNSSNPILCVNEDMFEQAGLDPNDPPETFAEVRDASEQLVAAGVCDYGITFANYSWFVEQWFAEAGQELVNKGNGRAGVPDEAYLDSQFGQDFFQWWTDMEADGLYHNPGIKARGTAKKVFHDERAAMVIGSTSSLNSIEAGADFGLKTGYLPVLEERNGVLVGGASLWIGKGLDPETESAVGDFFAWLLEPEQQARWHRETGYFPVSKGAVDTLRREGWFEENPHFATAFDQFQESSDTPATNGAQMGPFPTVRGIIEDGRTEMPLGEDITPTLRETNAEIEAELAEWNS